MVERFSYNGGKNTHRFSNGTVELWINADVGPRIVHYGFRGGPNLFDEVNDDAGRTGGSQFRLYGGHRLWVSPEVERTYYPDNAPVSVTVSRNAVRFTAQLEVLPPGTHLQKELEIDLADMGSRVSITDRITNHDSSPTTLAPCSPTMIAPGGSAILPLSPRIATDKVHYLSVGTFGIWSFTDSADPRWVFGTSYIQLRQLANPKSRFKEQMGGMFNSTGWGAYYLGGHLFIKRAPVMAGAKHPDFGCNCQVFTNPDFLEWETLAPLVELQPQQTVEHVEHCWLFDKVPSGADDTWIESIVLPMIPQAV